MQPAQLASKTAGFDSADTSQALQSFQGAARAGFRGVRNTPDHLQGKGFIVRQAAIDGTAAPATWPQPPALSLDDDLVLQLQLMMAAQRLLEALVELEEAVRLRTPQFFVDEAAQRARAAIAAARPHLVQGL